MKKAYPYIDFLKMFGLLCIMLAHINPPIIIHQLRNFDVPLMVIISGLLASLNGSENLNEDVFFKYIKKRTLRLVIPVWIFLCLYFLVLYLFTKKIDCILIVKSFCFQQDSIGYVWVILVYVIAAIMTLPLLRLYERFGVLFIISYFIIYLIYEVLVFFKIGVANRLVIYTFYYAIPYGLILLLGLLYTKISKRKRIIIVIISFFIFLVLFIILFLQKKEFVVTQKFKYPPRLYWISYGVCISYVLIMICEHFDGCKLFNNRVVHFIGRNTLWIYLWHIPLVNLSSYISEIWSIRFFIVVLGSIGIDFLQSMVILFIEQHNEKAKTLTRFFHG